jgi:tight adherence protein B
VALVLFVMGLGGAGVVVAMLVRGARRYEVVDRFAGLRARSAPPTRRRVVPRSFERRLERALDQAAVELTVDHALQVWAAVIGGVAAICLAFTASLGACVAGALLAAVATPVALAAARGRRARLLAAAVPVAVEGIASELRAGGTISTGITQVAAGDSALAPDFRRVETRVRLGAGLSEALREWTRERPDAGVEVIAGALAMCAAFGGRAADALDDLAGSLRDRLAVVAEARALSAQARLSALVVGGTPLLYLAFTAVSDPRALHSLTGSTVGRACVALGLALEALGAWWMRRIVRAGSVW